MLEKKQLLDFVEKYGEELMYFALSLVKNRPDAEDACQEMLVQMIRHSENFDGNRDIKNWAFTILYRKCLDQLKKRRRFLNFFERAAEACPARKEDGPENSIQMRLPESVLNRLKPKEKACLLLWAKEGYNTEEIAHIVGYAPGTVRVHLFQARKKLKKLMERGNEKKVLVSSG
ncbi:MAG: RNA polymerase sigma factor [Candidatus Saccharicenans sp.]